VLEGSVETGPDTVCHIKSRFLQLRTGSGDEAISFAGKDCFAPLAMTRSPQVADMLLEQLVFSTADLVPLISSLLFEELDQRFQKRQVARIHLFLIQYSGDERACHQVACSL
jgi:hypothetical protein